MPCKLGLNMLDRMMSVGFIVVIDTARSRYVGSPCFFEAVWLQVWSLTGKKSVFSTAANRINSHQLASTRIKSHQLASNRIKSPGNKWKQVELCPIASIVEPFEPEAFEVLNVVSSRGKSFSHGLLFRLHGSACEP